MHDDDSTEVVNPEELLECLKSLPDEKVSAGRIGKKLDSSSEFGEALNEVVMLGEVEHCQRRGTGPRVWYKHRGSSNWESPGEVVGYVWQCYVAEGPTKRIADRLFQRRGEAIRHLKESAVVDPERFEEVPYLDGVWRAPTKGSEGYKDMTAVIRKEPIYHESEKSEKEGDQSTDESNSRDQITLGDI